MTTVCCTTQKLNLVLMGLPGSGKGTQGEKIAQHYGIKHMTSGDLLRTEVERNGKHAKTIQRLMETGELFPDDLVNKIFLDHVPEENFILDGYPRRLSQTETFQNIDLAIYIEVPEDEVVKRILKRNQGRADDTPEAIQTRLDAFKEETKPVLDYYRKRSLLVNIDGRGTPEEVFERVRQAIFEKFNLD